MTEQPDQGWRQWVLGSQLPRMEAATTEQTTGFQPAPAGQQPPFSVGMHLKPQFDPLALLPPAAQEKLRALRLRSAEGHAVIPPFEDIREASLLRVESENALRRLTAHPHDGGFNLKPDDRRVTAAQRTLDKATDDFERIKQRSETRTAAWHAASGSLANVETWLKSGRPGGTALEDFEGEPPKLNKNETVLDAVVRLRRRVRKLKADAHRIQSAPYPSSYVKLRMRAQIEALAMQGAPSVSLLIEHDGEIIWPMRQVQVQVYNAQPGAVGFVDIPDTVAMDAWRHKSELIAALDAEINTEADDPAALAHEAREQREAETMVDLLSVERDECALVWQAQAQNLPCEHRGDISPVALLGLKLVTTPRANAMPETTPGLSWPLRR